MESLKCSNKNQRVQKNEGLKNNIQQFQNSNKMVDIDLRPNRMLFIRNSVKYEQSERLQIKASKTICYANLNQMKAEIATLILEKSTSE